ncbi:MULTISPECIES: hypothetical protein [unclassified Acetobacterium]|jgi:hypothetical protein|uniref:hypothetical protein n=1 Tax=unclassified Acetobacterium TaxID=2638182 RepID=UPI000DBECAE7|nr:MULTISPECIES: hypothetical protein [unclassified Acetobacterium]AWW27043.1 hypothetical protein DOZ58_10620 [Acetobacterium sp. KB-1]MDZ5726655.1 hypothetical protein [Acetobacterium sp. K1/6]
MKAKLVLVSSLALMLATAGTTFAASGYGQGSGVGQSSGGERQYANSQESVDADGDGICDLTGDPVGTGGLGYESGTNALVDEDGVCDIGDGTPIQDGSGLQRGNQSF